MKIKTKLILGLGTILLSTGIMLNIAIRNILSDKLETTIKESLNQIMVSTTEAFKYRTSINISNDNSEKLKNESEYLLSYMSLHNECTAKIQDFHGNILANNTQPIFDDDLATQINKVDKTNALIMIKYIDSSCYGILSYPIFIDSEYQGTFSMIKDYSSLNKDNLETINLITLIQIVFFIIIFTTAYFITNTVIKPIISLTAGVKKIEEGDYNFSFNTKRKDEVGILSSEFIKMKDQIKTQIQTIKEEKEKILKLEQHRKFFFDNVTHEIKTPITAITGYSEMLASNMIQDEDFNKRALNRIHSESLRINKLVLDLIEVSKGQTQSTEPFNQIKIDSIINYTIEDMNLKAAKYGLHINSTLKNGIIYGQENRLKQLFINLLDNAIKYSNNSNEIIVRSTIDGNKYIIKISNLYYNS